MNYKGIIFDFFGVISSEVAPFWFAKYFLQEQIGELKEKYAPPADRGEISYKQFIDQIARVASASPEDVKKEWDNLVVINENVIAFIKKAKSIYKIGLLSDAPAEFLRGILHAHNLESLFDEIVIFIDDNVNNIKLAEQLGIKGYEYDSTKDLAHSVDELDPSLKEKTV